LQSFNEEQQKKITILLDRSVNKYDGNATMGVEDRVNAINKLINEKLAEMGVPQYAGKIVVKANKRTGEIGIFEVSRASEGLPGFNSFMDNKFSEPISKIQFEDTGGSIQVSVIYNWRGPEGKIPDVFTLSNDGEIIKKDESVRITFGLQLLGMNTANLEYSQDNKGLTILFPANEFAGKEKYGVTVPARIISVGVEEGVMKIIAIGRNAADNDYDEHALTISRNEKGELAILHTVNGSDYGVKGQANKDLTGLTCSSQGFVTGMTRNDTILPIIKNEGQPQQKEKVEESDVLSQFQDIKHIDIYEEKDGTCTLTVNNKFINRITPELYSMLKIILDGIDYNDATVMLTDQLKPMHDSGFLTFNMKTTDGSQVRVVIDLDADKGPTMRFGITKSQGEYETTGVNTSKELKDFLNSNPQINR
jgi:hypothetical protein